jgi:hypothetical protein
VALTNNKPSRSLTSTVLDHGRLEAVNESSMRPLGARQAQSTDGGFAVDPNTSKVMLAEVGLSRERSPSATKTTTANEIVRRGAERYPLICVRVGDPSKPDRVR